MKKLLAVTATAALALSLAACDWGTKKADPAELNETSLNETAPVEGETLNATETETANGTDTLGNTAEDPAENVVGNDTVTAGNTL